MQHITRFRGFSLVEVMVALLVMSVGLLGLAALMVNGLKYNDEAALHSQAVMYAYDMADKIRTNSGAAGEYEIAYEADIEIPPNCNAQTCDPRDMALSDLAAWKDQLASNLPQGQGLNNYDAALDQMTINVRWNERGQMQTYSLVVAL